MSERILDPIDVDRDVKAVYAEVFTIAPTERKSFGSIPPELHEMVLAHAKARGLVVGEYIASLVKFRMEYSMDNEEELSAQRKLDKEQMRLF